MDILALNDRALDQATLIVDRLSPEDMALPAPCTEWSVRDVLNHLVAGNWRFAKMAEGQSAPPPRGLPSQDFLGDDPARAYRESANALKRIWREPGRLEGRYQLPIGEMPGEAAVGIRLVENVVHGWDLARATGQEPAFDPEIVEAALRFTQRTLGSARAAGAPFGPPVEAGEDAAAIDRLAAFMGRKT